MDFSLNENQAFLKDGAERFFRDRYGFDSRRKRLAAQSGTDRAMWSQFAEMGWLGLMVPEDQGGLGWTTIDAAVILGECGKVLVAEPYLEGGIVAVSMLTGSQSPKALGALAAIVDGSVLVVPALLEGGSRYAFEKPATQAKIDGDGYRLSGKKILVTGGDAADEFIVSASLDGQPALFLVSAGDDDLTRTTYRQLDGSWAADIALKGVRVDGDALVGGIEALTRGLDSGAIGVAALEVGILDRVLEVTADYIHIRKQFGQPLASFQALQHIMADLFINTEMARSSVHSGLAGTLRSANERQKAISAARVRCDRAALTVGNMGIYLHGGMGMTMEYPVGHHYRRLVQLTRAFGDTEYHVSRYEGLAFADN